MRAQPLLVAICGLTTLLSSPAIAQGGATPPGADSAPDPVKTLAQRLDLDRYKETIKGLTTFGDRRQGTDRNAAAVTWIESKLKSYGCADVERITYDYQPAPPAAPRGDSASTAASLDVVEETYQILVSLGHSQSDARNLLERVLTGGKASAHKSVDALIQAVYEQSQR